MYRKGSRSNLAIFKRALQLKINFNRIDPKRCYPFWQNMQTIKALSTSSTVPSTNPNTLVFPSRMTGLESYARREKWPAGYSNLNTSRSGWRHWQETKLRTKLVGSGSAYTTETEHNTENCKIRFFTVQNSPW